MSIHLGSLYSRISREKASVGKLSNEKWSISSHSCKMRRNTRRNLNRHLRLTVGVMFLVRICRSSHLRPLSLSLHLHLKDNLPLLYLLKDNLLLLSLSPLKNNLFPSLLLLKNHLHLLLKGTLHLFLNELILYPLLVPNLHVRYQKPYLHIVQ